MINEYEREPVPEHACSVPQFPGPVRREHTAGTELMIGPLFVAAGVSAVDILCRPARRQPARGPELAVPDGAHRDTCAPHALLPARKDLRSEPGHALQPRQRRDVLLPRRRDGDRQRHRRRRCGSTSGCRALNDLVSQQRGLGDLRARHGCAHHGRGGVRVPASSRAWPTSPRRGWCSSSSRTAWSACGRSASIRRAVSGLRRRRSSGRRRPAAGPGEVHRLARPVLRLVLQHGHAHRHGDLTVFRYAA